MGRSGFRLDLGLWVFGFLMVFIFVYYFCEFSVRVEDGIFLIYIWNSRVVIGWEENILKWELKEERDKDFGWKVRFEESDK